MEPCPLCVQKMRFVLLFDIVDRYQGLKAFYQRLATLLGEGPQASFAKDVAHWTNHVIAHIKGTTYVASDDEYGRAKRPTRYAEPDSDEGLSEESEVEVRPVKRVKKRSVTPQPIPTNNFYMPGMPPIILPVDQPVHRFETAFIPTIAHSPALSPARVSSPAKTSPVASPSAHLPVADEPWDQFLNPDLMKHQHFSPGTLNEDFLYLSVRLSPEITRNMPGIKKDRKRVRLPVEGTITDLLKESNSRGWSFNDGYYFADGSTVATQTIFDANRKVADVIRTMTGSDTGRSEEDRVDIWLCNSNFQ
jgi:hypothetical protein